MGTTSDLAPALVGALDPDSLLSGTREVYWWAAFHQGHTHDSVNDVLERGAEPSPFRKRLLDAWALASPREHSRLRLAYPEYAGAVLMCQHKGLTGVREFLDALLLDVADLGVRRRATFRAAPRG